MREPAWTIDWVIGASSEKPGYNSVAIFADGQMQFDAWDHDKRFELGGLATMARRLGFPEERALEKTAGSAAALDGAKAPSRKGNHERNAEFRAREIEQGIERRRETFELIPKALAACSALRAQGPELHDPDGPQFRWVSRDHMTRPDRPFAWRIGDASFGKHIIVPIRWGRPTIHIQASALGWRLIPLTKLERHLREKDTVSPHIPATLRAVITLIGNHLTSREQRSS